MTPKKLDPFQVAGYFCGLPGIPRGPKWFVKDIPPLPGDNSQQEQDLNLLIAPILALKALGSSKELTEKLKAVQDAAEAVQNHPILRKKYRNQYKSTFDELSADIQSLMEISRKAENFLRVKGWKYDSAEKTVTQAVCRNRPKKFFNEVVWAIYSTRYSSEGNSRPVRRKISRELSNYFFKPGTPELSVMAGAPIHLAIYNRDRGRK